jgi:hypothetical protein
MDENRRSDKDSVRKLEAKGLLEEPSSRWNNIKIAVKNYEWCVLH